MTLILSLANVLERSRAPIQTPTASFLPPLYVAQNIPYPLLLLTLVGTLHPLEISLCRIHEQVLSKSLATFPSLTGSHPILPHFSILHFHHSPLLESCPFLGFLTLLSLSWPPPADPSFSVCPSLHVGFLELFFWGPFSSHNLPRRHHSCPLWFQIPPTPTRTQNLLQL